MNDQVDGVPIDTLNAPGVSRDTLEMFERMARVHRDVRNQSRERQFDRVAAAVDLKD